MEKLFFPSTQRRVRADQHIRELTATVRLSYKNFIQPIFIDQALSWRRTIAGLPGVEVHTVSSALSHMAASIQNGSTRFLLFPVPAEKQEAPFDFSFAGATIKTIKQQFGSAIWIAADLCLCSYTTHGHCGILSEDHSKLLNSKTVEVLSRYAFQLAQAGADCIAPSDMMDGRIAAIRTSLDALGFDHVSIMSYASKFSSQFYGPFRDACHSSPNSKELQDRKSYQISPFNSNDAMASALRDEKEGADILMVKPALLYTDIIAQLKKETYKPIAAYHVSGEYAAIEALAEKGLLNREAAHLEVWAALQRNGADIIISYAAQHARKWIQQYKY